jgi:hypothetical protein
MASAGHPTLDSSVTRNRAAGGPALARDWIRELFIVPHQHTAERCPAADPALGTELVNHLTRLLST